MPDQPTHFGFKTVSPEEKTQLVGGVFSSVAKRYDIMNDLMSLGTHRVFKRMTVDLSEVRPGDKVLDLAGGTGDLAALFAPIVSNTDAGNANQPQGSVILADLTANMIQVGRDRLIDAGHTAVQFCQLRAEQLPFANDHFDCVTIGFGLRNFTSKESALAEIYRVLKPGGVLLVLEFSKPENSLLETAYAGFQSLWPIAGNLLVKDSGSYEYLVESIRMHPEQKVLKLMFEDAGFADTEYFNLLGGIAAIHRGKKPA